jgi:hypothetical protein
MKDDRVDMDNFNKILPQDDQQRWLEDHKVFGAGGPRKDDLALRLQFGRQFGKLKTYPIYPIIKLILRDYIQKCIPLYVGTEQTFWNISCLPNTTSPEWPRLACISMYFFEAFVVGHYRDEPDRMWGFVNVSRTRFQDFYPDLDVLTDDFDEVELRSDANYKVCKGDCLQIRTDSPYALARLLDNQAVLAAARQLNLQVMRQGRNPYAKYHCFDLADLLVE